MPNLRRETSNQFGHNVDMEHSFLDLQPGAFSDRIHMGSMRLSSRINIYLLFSFFAILIFAGMFVYVDHRVAQTLTHWRTSQDIAELVGRIETGVAKINGQEKQFSINKDSAAAEAFDLDIIAVSSALDKLNQLPESMAIRQSIATLRDGLVQYDEQFVGVVRAEKVLGIADATGISARLQKTTKNLQIRFSQTGHSNLSDQIVRINRQGRETLSSGSREGVDEIRKRYGTLHAFLGVAEIADLIKAEIMELLKAHETDMLMLINQRFALDSEQGRFNDLLAYVAPSLDLLTTFSKNQTILATQNLEKIQFFARYTIAGGSAAILMWLVFVGLLLMRSMAGGVRTIAGAAQRIAAGERNVSISGRGNIDAVGQVARALDKWCDDVSELDRLRMELEQTNEKLNLVIAQSDLQVVTAVESAKASFVAEVALEAEQRAYAPAPELPPELHFDPEPLPETESEYVEERVAKPSPAYMHGANTSVSSPLISNAGMGPISSVSQQLAHFSEYVTEAAADVERTEYLVASLQDATGQIESLSHLVTSVRDQTNLLAFNTNSQAQRPNDPENLIPFNEPGRQNFENGFAEQGISERLDSIRDATERAERTVQSIRISMQTVTSTANEIASMASNQALEATNKLLTQSEHLQSLLDDIIIKMSPSEPAQASPLDEHTDESRASQYPFGRNPNRKA